MSFVDDAVKQRVNEKRKSTVYRNALKNATKMTEMHRHTQERKKGMEGKKD